jgi:type VI secretion system protein ImpF
VVDHLPPQERLQPALLDRLTDDAPERTLEPREQRVLSKSRLRQAVLRDLAWLFNATCAEVGTDFTDAPHARRSVINFGLPSMSGRTMSTFDATDLERAVRQAILDFEPRILPEGLEVRAVGEPGHLEHHNVIGVEIRGHLWAQPVPLELLIRTEIDLETGQVQVTDTGSSRVS